MNLEMRGFKENIECVEKHLEFVYENLSEISEKVSEVSREDLDTINVIRGYILSYYRIIQELKIIINYLEQNNNEELANYVYNRLDNIRMNLRTIRKILHNIKNKVIDKEYVEVLKNKDNLKESLLNFSYKPEILSFLEEIMDCRGNLYAAERHLTEFLTAFNNKFRRK